MLALACACGVTREALLATVASLRWEPATKGGQAAAQIASLDYMLRSPRAGPGGC